MNTNCGIVIYTRLNTLSIEQGQRKEYPMNIKPKTLLHSNTDTDKNNKNIEPHGTFYI